MLSKSEIKEIAIKKIEEEISITIYYGPCLKNYDRIKIAGVDLAVPTTFSPAFKEMRVEIFVKIIDTGFYLDFDYSYSHFRRYDGFVAEYFYNFAEKKWKQCF